MKLFSLHLGRDRKTRRAARAAILLAAACAAGGCNRGGSGQIRVATLPEGATLTCNGRGCDVTPSVVGGLVPGTYLLAASKQGFFEARKTVTLAEDGQRISVEMKLDPVFGLALVQSKPEGAEVMVDGAFRGKTPFFLTDLPLGDHRFSFSAPGRLPKELTVKAADRTPQRVFADLASNAGRLLVRSQPPGARVWLNGVDRGPTPCDIPDMPGGESAVEFRLDGYELHTEKVTLQAQESKEISANLTAIPTTLSIVSMPEGARIYADNQFRGTAPVKLTDLPAGEHRLRAELKGFATEARTVTLKAQNEVTEEFRMSKNSGKIVLVTEPPGVKIFLNGEDAGTTRASDNPMVSEPLEIDLLQPGDYRVQLMRKGYSAPARTVKVGPSAVVDLHERLSRRFIPDTRLRMRGEGGGEIVRDGMLLRTLPNGNVELQLETGTVMTFTAADIVAKEPLKNSGTPP